MSNGTPPPKPMDFSGIGRTQANAVNNAGQSTLSNPFASSSWTVGPDGKPMQQTQFAGGIGDAAAGLQSQTAALGQGLDWSQFGQVGTGDAARQQATDAYYNQATSRLDPQWDRRMEAQRTQLLNQGLDPNSAAFKNRMQDFNFARNDAYGSAMNSAQLAGQSAGDSVFRNNLASQQNSIANALRARGQPLQEMQQLLGLAQFQPNTALQGQLASSGILKDFLGQQYQQDWHKYDTDAGQARDTANAVGSAAGALLGPLGFFLGGR